MALKGTKVLEFAGLAPAPFCGMVLADFGASVLRIDKIGANTNLDTLSQGKQSIALNLKHPEGVNIIKKLCRTSDVLIEPFRVGVMESLGLGPEVLLKDNPKLVYARLTGFGQSGIYSKRAGHDINYVGLSGLLSLFGRYGEKPVFPVNLASDFGGGGLICALGILMALFERTNSGLGQVVDANMVEGTAYLGSWLYRSQSLPIWGQERGKNVLDTGVHFYETYETKDGKYMSVGALEPQFYDQLIRGLELNDEDEAPQFGADFDGLKKLFARKFLEKTQEEWCRVFDGMDACVFPVLSLEEAPQHLHNLEQKSFVQSTSTRQFIPKPAPRLSRSPATSKINEAVPERGQHTERVLRSLNYTSEDIARLKSQDVIEIAGLSKL